METLSYVLEERTCASSDFGILRGPGTNPQWIPRDDCIVENNTRILGEESNFFRELGECTFG